METIRCGGCAALLFKAKPAAIAGEIEIKCRRCRRLTRLRPIEVDDAYFEIACGRLEEAFKSTQLAAT
jgi:phage FluMu protein Com